MTENLAKKFAGILAEKGFIGEDDIDLYMLGIDVILSTAIASMAIVFIGIVLNNVWGAVLFLLCFSTIRNYSGGFHASTKIRCFLVTMGSYILSYLIMVICTMTEKCIFFSVSQLVTIIASNFVFLKRAPVENKNKRLPNDWKQRNRKRTFLVLFFWQIMAVVLLSMRSEFSIQIFATIVVIAVLLLAVREVSE